MRKRELVFGVIQLAMTAVVCLVVYAFLHQDSPPPPAADPEKPAFVVTETAPTVEEQPSSPIESTVTTGCDCCDNCPCAVCTCKEFGERCCPECTCGPTTAMYCCEHCMECRRYTFPNGRPTEPKILCPKCGGVQYRNDSAKGAAVERRLRELAARQPLFCST